MREAINNANAKTDTTGGDCMAGTGIDVINFGVSGTITIAQGALPAIANKLTIDGTGQAISNFFQGTCRKRDIVHAACIRLRAGG